MHKGHCECEECLNERLTDASEVVRSNDLLSSCPVCERKGVVVHHTKPIEFWTCSWCKDVFVMEEIEPGKRVVSLMRGVGAV